MSSAITKSSNNGQETSICNLDVQLPNAEGDMHTRCIMICLVIPILSILRFIQSLYSLSKLPITC